MHRQYNSIYKLIALSNFFSLRYCVGAYFRVFLYSFYSLSARSNMIYPLYYVCVVIFAVR